MGIKKLIRKTAELIFQSKWYPNKKILLESRPDMSCQTQPVFEYMLKMGLNKKYKLIWLVYDKEKYKDVKIDNVKFMNFTPKTRLEKFIRLYTLCTSRAMLYTNRYIGKIFDKQYLMYLRHGTSLKSRLGHCRKEENNESDACISLSSFFTKYDVLEAGGITEEKFIVTGYPRNDCIFDNVDFTKKIYPNHTYNKIILWMPTFRKIDDSDRVDSTFEFPLEIPCLYTIEDCQELNKELRKRNILLVLKPHPGQKLTAIKDLGLTNFVLLYNEDLDKNNVQLYQFVGSTDALITDYSSIYYDYLLTGNPIGLTVDDFDTYSKDTGFVYENVFDYIVGEHILNVNDFIGFVINVANGQDILKKERFEKSKMYHEYFDGNSTKRVYELLSDELKNRYD